MAGAFLTVGEGGVCANLAGALLTAGGGAVCANLAGLDGVAARTFLGFDGVVNCSEPGRLGGAVVEDSTVLGRDVGSGEFMVVLIAVANAAWLHVGTVARVCSTVLSV